MRLPGGCELLEVRCRRCSHESLVDLTEVVWPRDKPVHTLAKVLRCQACKDERKKTAAGPSGVAATTPRGRSASGETARSQLRPTKHHPALGPACQPPLKECSLLGRLGQTNTDLAPSKPMSPSSRSERVRRMIRLA